jgi:DNA-binding response OmpR family regulator
VYGIVNQTGGQVFVHSRPGEGSVFEVCLPRMDVGDSVADISTTSKSDQSNTRGSEVILIVEDEAQIRAPISRALRERGYFVLEAKNGNDALDVLQQYHAPVHLVVSDVVMPEMSGTELVQLLHAWYPTLKVLFVSGKMPDTATTAALGSTATYMAKPFTAEELARQVRNILDDGNGRRNSASVRHP